MVKRMFIEIRLCNPMTYVFKPIQDGPFWSCSRMGGEQKGPTSLKSVTHMMKLGTVIPYLKKTQKYESCDTPLQLCWHQQFFIRNQQTLLYQKIQIQIPFWYIISNPFNFFEVFKDFVNKHSYNFDDVSKTGFSRAS